MVALGEWTPDFPDRDNSLVTAKNVIPHGKSYKSFNDIVAVSTTATGERPTGIISAKDADGNSATYCGDASNLYQFEADNSLDEISKTTDVYTAGVWEFAVWGTDVLAVNGLTDTPQKIAVGSVGNFADLGGSPPPAKHIAIVEDFVVLGNISDGATSSNKIHWSAINDSTGWTVGTNQSDKQTFYTGGEVKKIVGGEYGIIILETAIYRMEYEGLPLIFRFHEVEPEIGTISSGSVVNLGSTIWFIGGDAFYEFNGTQAMDISANKVSKTFFADLDQNYLDRITSTVDPINNVVYWSYPGTGNASGRCNKIIAYNYVLGRWSLIELETFGIATALSSGWTLDAGIGGAYPNIDTLVPYSLDSRAWIGGASLLYAFDADYKIANFNGDALTAEIETGEVQLNPGGRSHVKAIKPLYDGDGSTTISMRIGERNSVDGSVTYTSFTTPNSQTGECNFRSDAYYHRMNMFISNGFTHLYGFDVDFVPSGRK